MKYINFFETASELSTYINSDEFFTPGLSYVDQTSELKYHSYFPDYLTFKADDLQTLSFKGTDAIVFPDLEYSVNDSEWTTLSADTSVEFGGDNGNLRLRGKSS